MKSYGEDRRFRCWCSKVRRSKKTIDNNKNMIIRVSEDNISRIAHFEQLAASKAKHRIYNVKVHGEDRLRRHWCSSVRQTIRKIAKND